MFVNILFITASKLAPWCKVLSAFPQPQERGKHFFLSDFSFAQQLSQAPKLEFHCYLWKKTQPEGLRTKNTESQKGRKEFQINEEWGLQGFASTSLTYFYVVSRVVLCHYNLVVLWNCNKRKLCIVDIVLSSCSLS